MAKSKYKIEEAKKDSTLSFRIPNRYYDILKQLSKQQNRGINVYAREKLIEFLHLQFPELFIEDMDTLINEKMRLMDEGDKISEIAHYEHMKIVRIQAETEERQRQSDIILEKIKVIRNKIKFIDDKIQEIETIQGVKEGDEV